MAGFSCGTIRGMAFWADTIADEIQERYAKAVASGEPLVIRDEKTASGRILVGALRGVAVHGAIAQALAERDVAHTFLYEINDFDAFDSVPGYLDESYKEHLGKPLFAVPAPEPGAENYAVHFGEAFKRTIEASGFHPHFYYVVEQYRAGKFNEVIRLALEHRDDIDRIYQEVSGSKAMAEKYPLMVICEHCGKVATTRVTDFDGEQVTYVCDQEGSGATGCGEGGKISPFDGNAKLPWKVDWAAKFKVFDVDIEGEGKDLSTKGGARDVANHITKEVFEYEPPFDVPYEFFLIGGKKISTSKGNALPVDEFVELLPQHMVRFALLEKDIKRAIDFDPAGDTIPRLYDEYDKYANLYWSGTEDDFTRLWIFSHTREKRELLQERFLPRFSQVVFLMQMPHINVEEEVAKMKGAALSNADKKELEERMFYAGQWLKLYAPENYKFELQEESVPEAAQNLSVEQKDALRDVLRYIEQADELDGQELHTKLHEIRKESGIDAKEFFSAIYLAFLGKDHGPKAGWFLSVLNREFLIERLNRIL